MKVSIRADASIAIGTGHIMRCLALAEAFRAQGADVHFVSRNHSGNIHSFVERQGFPVRSLPLPREAPTGSSPYERWLGVPWEQDADETLATWSGRGQPPDWVVVDHYGLDARWERRLRATGPRLLVIDDLANRPHDCDLLLDSAPHPDPAARYKGLLSPGCRGLYGPRYLPIRREFATAFGGRRLRDGQVRNILVFLGGSDPDNFTGRVLDAIETLSDRDWSLDVVGGASNARNPEHAARLREWPQTRFHAQTSEMPHLMHKADLAIGGGGTSSWERALLGLPSITIPWAENQIPGTREMERLGLVRVLMPREAQPPKLASVIQEFVTQPARGRELSQRALALAAEAGIDGATRVAQAMAGVAA